MALEPMLRADTVTAYLRLTSLWRGRLEIGTLDLDNPSLNLVRRTDGHWNIEELVERAAQVSPAPTGKTRPEVASPLPLRRGLHRPHQLQTGPGEEGLRLHRCRLRALAGIGDPVGHSLEARPVRTDVNINDTGTLTLDGRFQRGYACEILR